MIHLIVGENAYARTRVIEGIVGSTTVAPERYDGTDMTDGQLADCIAGGMLFSTERLIIISSLSDNKPLWEKLADWTDRIAADTTVVLIEPKPDRRTKSYKTLSKLANVSVVDMLTDRQAGEARHWLQGQARDLRVSLSADQQSRMVASAMRATDRPGYYVIDQQLLDNALHSLMALDEVTDDHITAVLPEPTADNVFELMEAALSRDTSRVATLLHNLQLTSDPYMVMGLIVSQWSQLLALVIAKQSPDVVAAHIGASAFVLKKLAVHARALSSERVKSLTQLLTDLDIQLKSTGMDPWTAVARFIGELSK